MKTPHLASGPAKDGISIRPMIDNIEQMVLPIGSNVGKYCIVEEIDRGGMAVVYKAVQTDLDRFVALKIMPSNISLNTGFMERFMREAHAVAALNHPNIVSIHEVGRENNVFYLAMEYVPGPNLYNYLFQAKPKLVEVLDILSALAGALAYAHDRKIIHRDLKLNNVIMKNRSIPVLIDFGLAKMLGNEGQGGLTRTGELIGSPAYMAPERLSGGATDFRSDVCSLGIMLYEMLTFKNPYLDQRNLHQTAMNVMDANPLPPRKLVRWLPAEIEAITLRAMAKDPNDRYQSMEDFKADINRYQAGKPVEARPPTLWSRTVIFFRKRWPVLSIAATVVLFSLLVSGIVFFQNRKELSHWEILHTRHFSDRAEIAEWSIAPSVDSAVRTNLHEWKIEKGFLIGASRGRSFSLFDQRINNEVRIEFETGPWEKSDLYNAGIFLFGPTPDSAYRFFINRSGDGSCGIVLPGSDFLLQSGDKPVIRIAAVNHIRVEWIQNTITLAVNGVVAARIPDFLPPLGKSHDHAGFFVEGGSAWFDNVRISRRAVPATPSPTFVAERFRERGDFQAALDEYRTLLVDFKNTERAREIRLHMADCLLRLGLPDEALQLLQEKSGRSADESFESRRLLYSALVQEEVGRLTSADSSYRTLAQQFPGSDANQAAMVSLAVRTGNAIGRSRLDNAEKEIRLFADRYPSRPEIGERLAILLMDRYLQLQLPDSAIAVMERFLGGGPKENAWRFTAASAALGRAYLARGLVNKAAEILNRCITAPTVSEGVWQAWMELADIYSYDFKYPEARTIYRKVYLECPKTQPFPWQALLRLGEITSPDSVQRRQDHFTAVARGGHPFPLFRLMARYYLNELSDNSFRAEWEPLRSAADYTYLFCFARKALFSKNEPSAAAILQTLKGRVAPQSWDYITASRALNNLKKW